MLTIDTLHASAASNPACAAKPGFSDQRVRRAVPLADGALVDRVQRRFVPGERP